MVQDLVAWMRPVWEILLNSDTFTVLRVVSTTWYTHSGGAARSPSFLLIHSPVEGVLLEAVGS
jgi:hypothetical protein